jgi:selenide,water dikinase
MQQTPIARELVLVGGGHSHVIVLRMLGMQPIPGLQVTLVSPDTRTPYSGMLPGLIDGHYDEDDIHIDLVPLCRFAGARFVQATVSGLDALMQTVQLEGRPRIRYDVT